MRKLLIIYLIILYPASLLLAETEAVSRDSYYFSKKTVSTTSEPSTLQFYEFHENLADEIVIDVFNGKDLSNIAGKKIFVGYGTVDPAGNDCKVFTPAITGMDNNITICQPWWRVERTYQLSEKQGDGSGFKQFLTRMQRPRPPKQVVVCDEWVASKKLPGGTVTCTTYYDKSIDEDCNKNPIQSKCFKNNCGAWVIDNCENNGNSIGFENEALRNVELQSGTVADRYESRVNLITRQFTCPGGSYTNYANCLDEKRVNMHPYECKPDDPATPLDDSIMKYCDENRPVRDAGTGAITGFLGICPAEAGGAEVTCKVDSFSQTKNTCTKYAPSSKIESSELVDGAYDLTYQEVEVNVLSGALDIYSSDDNCVRANTIEDSRDQEVFTRVTASGYLDDDIYAIVHSTDDSHIVKYCNQQHNAGAGSKLIHPDFGVTQCIANNGTYAFDQTVPIRDGDVLSIQMANEAEDEGYTSFSRRSNYTSTAVFMDGIPIVPEVSDKTFPNYPRTDYVLHLFERTVDSLALMFPYAGHYRLYFFNNSGTLMATESIDSDDFNAIGSTGFKQLFLAKNMPIAPGLIDNDALCLDDDWTDYGGGVYGGKRSVSGGACQNPSSGNSYQMGSAITRVVVRDMLTGVYTDIPLVYPLGYPNRVFVSKLKLYENRKYHCYEQPTMKAPY